MDHAPIVLTCRRSLVQVQVRPFPIAALLSTVPATSSARGAPMPSWALHHRQARRRRHAQSDPHADRDADADAADDPTAVRGQVGARQEDPGEGSRWRPGAPQAGRRCARRRHPAPSFPRRGARPAIQPVHSPAAPSCWSSPPPAASRCGIYLAYEAQQCCARLPDATPFTGIIAQWRAGSFFTLRSKTRSAPVLAGRILWRFMHDRLSTAYSL